MRYLVDETGRWLPGNQRLISPVAIQQAIWSSHEVILNLTRQEIKESPSLESDEPVSRQKDEDMALHFGWPTYWGATGITGQTMFPKIFKSKSRARKGRTTGHGRRDPHLESLRDVISYHLEAREGSIGHLDDVIAEEDTWTIRHLVIDLHNWLPGKKILLPPKHVEKIQWSDCKLYTHLTRQEIEDSQTYDPSQPINEQTEKRVYDYYGRPKYWG